MPAQKKFPLELNVGNDANLSPLVDCCPPSGLYLLAEHTSEIINSELLKDLQATMEAMLSLQSQDILAERIFKAYGQYLFCTDVGVSFQHIFIFHLLYILQPCNTN
jgi:hypothetical protein